MTTTLQSHVNHYCKVVYGESMKAEVDKVVKDLIDLIPGISGFEIAHAVRVYNSKIPLDHVDNLDCPKRCGEWTFLKSRIEQATTGSRGNLQTTEDRRQARRLQAECNHTNVYCERPVEVEKRLRDYQAAVPKHDLQLMEDQ